MTIPPNSLKLLFQEFPDHPPATVVKAFEWTYDRENYAPTDNKRAWSKYIKAIKLAADQLAECESVADHEAIVACLPERIRISLLEIPLDEREVFLRDQALMESAWHVGFPKTGGSDPADHIIAQLVSLAFEALGRPITYGKSATLDDEPSGAFGRIVKDALKHHRSRAHWDGPTKREVRRWRGSSAG